MYFVHVLFRGQLVICFLFSTMWILEIKLRPIGLVANVITRWVILLAPDKSFFTPKVTIFRSDKDQPVSNRE